MITCILDGEMIMMVDMGTILSVMYSFGIVGKLAGTYGMCSPLLLTVSISFTLFGISHICGLKGYLLRKCLSFF